MRVVPEELNAGGELCARPVKPLARGRSDCGRRGPYGNSIVGRDLEAGFEPARCRSRPGRSATELPQGNNHNITRTLLASDRNTDSPFLLNHLEANWQELADYFYVRLRVHVEGHG